MLTKRQKPQEPMQIKKPDICNPCGKNIEITEKKEEPLHNYTVLNKQLSINLGILCWIQIILAVTYFSIFRLISVPEYYLYLKTVGVVLPLITIAGSVATLLWCKPEVE